jgi:antitoxin component YwqK of YwqJK toxin-antitoxin module
MKKILILLTILIFTIACKDNPKSIDNSSETIYDSNDVVKVDGVVSFKRNMEKVTGIIHGFHSNGNQKEAYKVIDGIQNGFSNSWNEEGQQRFEGFYKNGEKDGLWRFWWPNGQLNAESHYQNGMLNGTKKTWDRDGNLIAEEVWVNNNKQ